MVGRTGQREVWVVTTGHLFDRLEDALDVQIVRQTLAGRQALAPVTLLNAQMDVAVPNRSGASPVSEALPFVGPKPAFLVEAVVRERIWHHAVLDQRVADTLPHLYLRNLLGLPWCTLLLLQRFPALVAPSS